MSDYKTRLKEEHEELALKLRKLRAYILSEDYLVLSSYDQSLLSIQESAMLTYKRILLTRINK